MNRILVTGKNGQVGWELRRTLAPLGEVVAVGIEELDLAKPQAIRQFVRQLKPTLIVNPAAYTAVDKAESEPDLAMAINGTAPGVLAEEAKSLGALFVHYSTDYVFDGSKIGSYTEEDKPNPLNVYGQTKLAGEEAVAATGGTHLILRTSWIYGARGRNFLLTMLKLAKERQELKIVDDQIGAPTWCRMVAEATAQILSQLYSPLANRSPQSIGIDPKLSGIYHLTASGESSWHGFARAIVEHSTLAIPNLNLRLIPIPTEAYPLPAARPRNSRLDNSKLADTFGISMPGWDVALSTCMDEIQ
jgi:dTDP-4-dehydrorhamnose reductase